MKALVPGVVSPTGRLFALAMVAISFLAWPLDAQTRLMYLRGQSVHPAFEGWWPNDDGSYTLWFGYMNSNWEEELDVPVGPNNYLAFSEPGGLDDLEIEAYDPADADQGQPTHIYPRRNPFLFTITVPADFGDTELVWTLTTNGHTHRAFASLRGDYRMDPQVMSTEVGGAFGSLDDRLRTNLPPVIDVDGDLHRTVRVGEPVPLIAFSRDPDNYPPREDRDRIPESLDELYSAGGVGSVVASGAPGMRFSWTVYRGPAEDVSFDPEQLKAWMDTRVWGNSPWSPPYVLPELPPEDRWVTHATFSEPGEYVLRAVASDGSHFNYQNVTVVVTP
ncbi:MAG: hypothetical protein GEU90_07660 [Gemmatimonas sp.]|nr:hypothetical protein [Gemmatimonas sp.]